MLKTLLVFPPSDNIVLTTQPSFVVGNKGVVPPLGLLYLAAMVTARTDHQVKIVDCQVNKLSPDDIVREVVDYRPDVVGVSMITFMLPDVIKTIRAVRKAEALMDKSILIVGGGPHATIFPEESAVIPGIDYVLTGEAEYTFSEFLNRVAKGEPLESIPGVCYRRNEEIIHGPPNDLIMDLDDLPRPDRRLIEYKKYRNILAGPNLMTTMMTSRGCPFKCIFCDRLGKVFRPHSPEYILKEIEDCVSLGIKELFLHDDTFTVNKKRVVDLCQEIIKRDWKLSMACRSRVNTIDEEIIVLLKRAGFRRISFGIESGDPQILKRIKKGITLEQAQEAFRLCRKHGLSTLADFMIGHPGETIEEVRKTIKFAIKLNPDYAQFSITTPYPATELYRQAMDQGIISTDVWREFALDPGPDFDPPRWDENISVKELDDLIEEAYRRFYLRPRFVLRELGKSTNPRSFAKKVVAATKMMARAVS